MNRLEDTRHQAWEDLPPLPCWFRQAGGELIASAEIDDRGNPLVSLDVPNYPLAEYDAPGNHPADECPLCALGLPITAF